MKARVGRLRRPNMRRAVVLFPSGLTLGNLFFGVFAIIAASRGQFVAAGVYVLLGGICDALDGQVARATNAGTQFGEELDSLVDAITFGLAPGLIMYFAVLNRDNWDWLTVFLFAACAVMRLARFNIEQAGTAKTYFQGLPSPAAGITLASYYWFSQSWLYNYGAIADLPWHVLLRYLMAALGFLMISNIPYPVFPRTGFRSLRALGATVLLLGSIGLLVTKKLEFFFPFALCYVAWGPLRWVFSGLFERRQPTIPYDLSEGEDDEDEDDDAVGPIDSQVHASRQSGRELRVSTEERAPSRRERPDRTARPDRAPRPDRAARAEGQTIARLGPAEVDESPARVERPARPERTEAERAARREKREKRDSRRDRPPRIDAAAAATGSESGVGAITVGADEATESAPLLSVVRADADIVPIEDGERSGPEGGAGRKRKRRRRRGQRDRLGTESSDAGEAGDAGDASEGNDGSGGPDSFEAMAQSRESTSARDRDGDGERESSNRTPPAASPYRADVPSPPPDPASPPPGPHPSEPSA